MNIIREQTIVTFDNRNINTITQIKEWYKWYTYLEKVKN
jgi:hypothetical protein